MAGGYGAGDPPDPIPNSEVKTRCADGTAGATRWESTAPPAFFYTTPASILVIGAGVCACPKLPATAVSLLARGPVVLHDIPNSATPPLPWISVSRKGRCAEAPAVTQVSLYG